MASAQEDAQFTDIWSEAFDNYQRSTGRDIRVDPAVKSLRNTDDLLNKIESEHKNFDTFRNKHSKLWNTLNAAMRPIDLLSI